MSPCPLMPFMVLWHTFMRFMNSTYEGKHMPPHHGDVVGSHADIEATDAADRERVRAVGEGPWVGVVGEKPFLPPNYDPPTAVTRPIHRPYP